MVYASVYVQPIRHRDGTKPEPSMNVTEEDCFDEITSAWEPLLVRTKRCLAEYAQRQPS